jgi:hypothetical protein
MRRRLGLIASLALLTPLLASFGANTAGADSGSASKSASADDFVYKVYTMCADDTDGKECVVSATRNTVPVTTDYPSTPGTHEWFWVDNGYRDGMAGFALNRIVVDGGGNPTAYKDVDPTARWVLTVNTGPYKPRELNAHVENVAYTVGGNPTTGYWFRVAFNPAPVAWRFDGSSFLPCSNTYCGPSGEIAGFVAEGWANGYVTDLGDSGLGGSYINHRTGYVTSSNANWLSEPYFDSETNSLVLELANLHWKASGVPATGFFETRIPYSFLTNQLGVPYPESLTSGRFTVVRLDGTVSSVPFSLTHGGGGVWIEVHDITFSKPRYRLKAKPTAPGKPRWGSVSRVTATKVKLRFYRPLADGGPNITAYQGRCRRGTGAWHYNKATGSPIYIGSLSRRLVDCQVRAQNRIGYGRWNAVKRG